MPKTRIEHTFDCSEDTLWSTVLFNEEFSRRLYKDTLRFPVWRLLEQKDSGDTVFRKVFRRLMWFLFLLLVVSFMDRINIAFAALTMNEELGLNAAAYAMSFTVFYLTYALFEVPSNLVLARLGARLWLPLIMVCWALASLMNAWVTGPGSFYAIRLVLGVAEAGLYPGLLYVLTEWLPGSIYATLSAR